MRKPSHRPRRQETFVDRSWGFSKLAARAPRPANSPLAAPGRVESGSTIRGNPGVLIQPAGNFLKRRVSLRQLSLVAVKRRGHTKQECCSSAVGALKRTIRVDYFWLTALTRRHGSHTRGRATRASQRIKQGRIRPFQEAEVLSGGKLLPESRPKAMAPSRLRRLVSDSAGVHQRRFASRVIFSGHSLRSFLALAGAA